MKQCLKKTVSLAVLAIFLTGYSHSFAAQLPSDALAPFSLFKKQKSDASVVTKKRAGFIPRPVKSYPYDETRALEWIYWATSKPAERVRKKIIKNVRHVTFEEFDKNLGHMVNRLNAVLKDGKEYGVLCDSEPHASKRWVYELAKEHGLTQKPLWESYFNPFEKDGKLILSALKNAEGGKLPGRIVIFDDASYSGRQLYYMLNTLNKEYRLLGYEQPEIILVVPYMTNDARKLVENKGVQREHILCAEMVKMLDEVLTPTEQAIIQEDVLKRQGKEFDVHTVVTYFDHQAADRFSLNEIITAALKLKEMVKPPYWEPGTLYYRWEEKEYTKYKSILAASEKTMVRGGRWPWLTVALGEFGLQGTMLDVAQVAVEQSLWAVAAATHVSFGMTFWGTLIPTVILFAGLHYYAMPPDERAPSIADIAAVTGMNTIAVTMTVLYPETTTAVIYLLAGTLHFLFNRFNDDMMLVAESAKLGISTYRPGPVPRLFTKETLMETAGVPSPLWNEFTRRNKGTAPKAVYLTGVREEALQKQFGQQTAGVPDDELVFLSVEYFTTESTLAIFSEEVQVVRHIAIVAPAGKLRKEITRILDGSMEYTEYPFLLFFGEYPQRNNIHFYRVYLDEHMRGKKLMSVPQDTIAAILKANFPGYLLTAYVENREAIFHFLQSRGLNPVWVSEDQPGGRGAEAVRMIKEYEGAHAKIEKALYANIPGVSGPSFLQPAVKTYLPKVDEEIGAARTFDPAA